MSKPAFACLPRRFANLQLLFPAISELRFTFFLHLFVSETQRTPVHPHKRHHKCGSNFQTRSLRQPSLHRKLDDLRPIRNRERTIK